MTVSWVFSKILEILDGTYVDRVEHLLERSNAPCRLLSLSKAQEVSFYEFNFLPNF